MMEKALKKEIKSYLDKDPDYSTGLSLLVRVSKNKSMMHILSRKSSPRNIAKINAELRKFIGESNIPGLRTGEKKKAEKLPGSTSKASVSGKASKYPEIIQNIIHLSGDLNNTRDKLHRSLNKIPHLNTDDNIAQRKQIVEQIRSVSEIIEHYYHLKDRYFTDKIIPTPDDLKCAEKSKAKDSKLPLKDPLKGLSDADLVKKMNNVRSNISKKRNKLVYQSTSKSKEENPMPEGSKRDNILQQIKNDEMIITEIQRRLNGTDKTK